MECAGCRKLIPTHLFYEHLSQSPQQCLQQCIHSNRSQLFSNLFNLRNAENGGVKYNSSFCGANTTSNSMLFGHQGLNGQSFLGNHPINQTQYLINQLNEEEAHIKNSFPSFLHEKQAALADISNDMSTDRTLKKIMFLEEKLRKADEVLRESAIEIKNLREDRDRIKLENDRIVLQLEQTAT